MDEICLVSQEERDLFFRAAADKLNIPFTIIEKDYWVIWVLERLFSISELRDSLTFKGGTSLSKIYHLIFRFSEDIDLSIERDFLGFGFPNGPESASSKKKQKKILDNLSKTCSEYIQNTMIDSFRKEVFEKLKTNEGWKVFLDQDDPSLQTLLFEYPSQSLKTGYIRPLVKIEMGARSEHWPVSSYTVKSYTKEALGEKIYEPEVNVRVLNAERTFWEKATILHQYAHFPDTKTIPPRLSRHYYDFFCLLNSDIKKRALEHVDLLRQVASHKNLYFSSSWAKYDTAQKGSLKLFPPERINIELKKDYLLMKPMFFRNIPDWHEINSLINDFEKEFNN